MRPTVRQAACLSGGIRERTEQTMGICKGVSMHHELVVCTVQSSYFSLNSLIQPSCVFLKLIKKLRSTLVFIRNYNTEAQLFSPVPDDDQNRSKFLKTCFTQDGLTSGLSKE